MKNKPVLSKIEIDRIIEMAWEDRTPFDAIKTQFDLNESQTIQLMRLNMKTQSFKMWRKRVQNRATKHTKKRNFRLGTHKCTLQKSVSMNKISKKT